MSASLQLLNGWASVSAPTPVADGDIGDHLQANQSGGHN